ncbi:hypothetical protein [Pedobacter cryoconitis]|uniref:hypothetical protein n=1 Tax=Pedobacter cryoconitis TaxID=188932 RepID=UPI00160E3DD4|nr:hypothetical protein [Pedobacter cryoconitis]MBB5644212.1 FtsP/CotA-like multicopper oxidase with cupredoxin domain [Pedobacter cryoconitis]
MKKVKNIVWIVIGILIVGYVIYKIAVNSFTDSLLGNNPQRAKAVIIDHRNYMPNQPVKAEFSYSYQFMVNGEKYIGNSHDITVKVGDSVEIEYNKEHPNVNKPLNPKE